MRVLVNSWLGYPLKTGVGFYVEQLVRHLNMLGPAVEAVACCPPLRAWSGPGPERSGPQSVEFAGAGLVSGGTLLRPLMRSAWETARELSLLWNCRRHRIDLYHEPNYIPVPCDLPTVTTVHDLSVLLYPEWHPRDRVRYFERHFQRRLALTSRFIADSEFTRREMERHLGVPRGRIDVVPLAARPIFRPMRPRSYRPVLERLGLPSQYFLFVGTVEPRKNLSGLLRAYAALPPSVRDTYPLVVAGRWGWGSKQAAEQARSLPDHVLAVGYISEPELAAIYNGATALVYPSLYEGFGLPPLEMMACGRPVIASRRAALPEVVGDAGILIEPQDSDAIAEAIRAVADDGKLARQLAEAGLRRARQFSWARTALETLVVYRRAGGEPGLMPRAA